MSSGDLEQSDCVNNLGLIFKGSKERTHALYQKS